MNTNMNNNNLEEQIDIEIEKSMDNIILTNTDRTRILDRIKKLNLKIKKYLEIFEMSNDVMKSLLLIHKLASINNMLKKCNDELKLNNDNLLLKHNKLKIELNMQYELYDSNIQRETAKYNNFKSSIMALRTELCKYQYNETILKNEIKTNNTILQNTKDELHITKSELHIAKDKMHNTKNEFFNIKNELDNTKLRLQNAEEELHTLKFNNKRKRINI